MMNQNALVEASVIGMSPDEIMRDFGQDDIFPKVAMPLRQRQKVQEMLPLLNPARPLDVIEAGLRRLLHAETLGLVEGNRRVHRMLIDGIEMEVAAEDGAIRGDSGSSIFRNLTRMTGR